MTDCDFHLKDTFERLLSCCGLSILDSNGIKLNVGDWIATFIDTKYLVRVLRPSETGATYELCKALISEKEFVDCNGAILLYEGLLPYSKLKYLSTNLDVHVLDARTIGAHLSALSDEAANELEHSNESFECLGHFRLEGSDLYRSGNIMIYSELEGGLLHFVGESAYGNLRAGGPNIGTFDFVADHLDGHVKLFWDLPNEIPEQSAAQLGNLVVFEATSEFSDERYQAKFRFTEYGLVVEENQTLFTPYGFSVYFSGHYERAIFPSQEKTRFEVIDAEIEDVANNLRGVFRSFQVGSIEIKTWLEQFAPNERRPMLYLLRQVRFYNSLIVREAVLYLHKKFLDAFEVTTDSEHKQFLITTFGSPAKSGPTLSRMYRQENQLLNEIVKPSFEIEKSLEQSQDIKFIICPEDIVGSGQDMVNFLRGLNSEVGNNLKERDITVVLQIVCVLKEGLGAINEIASQLSFKTAVFYYELAEKCFSTTPEYTCIDEDWDEIKKIAESYGKRLKPDKPLGYENSQMLAVFHDNCPNNTLPILWASSREHDFYWNPLFPRE